MNDIYYNGRPPKYKTEEERLEGAKRSRAKYLQKKKDLKAALDELPDEMSHDDFLFKLVEAEYLRVWEAENRLVPKRELMETLGLRESTIAAYLNRVRSAIFADRCPEYRTLSKLVVEGQARKAIEEGDTQAAKLFLQTTKDIDTTPDVNINFIEPVVIRNVDGEVIETLDSEVSTGTKEIEIERDDV